MGKKMNCLPDCIVKDGLETHLCQGRAFGVLVSSNLLGKGQSHGVGNRRPPLLGHCLERIRVISGVQLGANQHNGNIGSVMSDFGPPL